MRRALPVLALLAGLHGQAAAQEFVLFDAPPDDDAFYRAAACAAPPGGACRKPFLRWPEARRDGLSVGLASVWPRLPGPLQREWDAGLDAAIAQINATGAGLRLRRDDAAPAIAVHVIATPPGRVIEGTGIDGLDGAALELGRVALTSVAGAIQDGLIAVSGHTPPAQIGPVLLEEVFQAMGLMTDLRGPGLDRSVLSEDTNAVARLSRRDRMALRRHYGADREG